MKTKRGGKKPKFAGFPKLPITTPTKQMTMQDETDATIKKEKKEKCQVLQDKIIHLMISRQLIISNKIRKAKIKVTRQYSKARTKSKTTNSC